MHFQNQVKITKVCGPGCFAGLSVKAVQSPLEDHTHLLSLSGHCLIEVLDIAIKLLQCNLEEHLWTLNYNALVSFANKLSLGDHLRGALG